MISPQDENKRALQQKYQKYKSAQLHSTQPPNPPQQPLSLSPTKKILAKIDQNLSQSHKRQQECQEEYKKMLKMMPKNDRILSVMMGDPIVQEMSENLRKEAQERHMTRLVEEFPERYRSLLEIQAKYYTLQRIVKQKSENHQKEVQNLSQKLQICQQKLKQSAQILNTKDHQLRIAQDYKYHQFSQQVRKKESTIFQLRDSLEQMEKKYSKIKEDYKNSNNVIMELREHEEEMQKESNRLIEKLKETEEKLIRSNKKLLQYDNDKKNQRKSLQSQHEAQLSSLKDQKSHIEQLLQQAHFRLEYKESLLKLSQTDSEATISKQQQQLQQKYQELQELRAEHLEALKTIDQLEERVNEQEGKFVREAQIWGMEKEEMRKQLDRVYQGNGELRAELEVKSQLIRMLEKSIECLKSSFDSDLQKKTTEWLQTHRELAAARHQLSTTSQKCSQLSTQNTSLQSQLSTLKQTTQQSQNKLQQSLKLQKQKVKNSQVVLRKYLEKIVEQQEQYCQLQCRIQEWMRGYAVDAIIGQDNGLLPEKGDNMGQKISRYEKIIEKLRKKIIELSDQSKVKSLKGNKILKDLIEENKQLKKELQHQHSKPATKISLFQ